MYILDFLPSPSPFLDDLFSDLDSLEIDVRHFELDHICYRVASDARYLELRELLIPIGNLISQKEVNSRPILVLQLDQPIIYQNRTIDVLELPAPKAGSPYIEGWEHVEFVINSDLNSFQYSFPNIQWDTKGLNKPINPDIRLRLGEKSVKFHENPLDYVIKHLD